MENIIEAAIGMLTEERGGVRQVLIAQRREQSVMGGYWEFPGGKIEQGETARQCVAREFTEELGITIRVGDAMAVIEHRYTHGHVRLHPFFCVHVSGELRDIAVAQHRWVLPSQLGDYPFLDANRTLIEQLMIGLAGHEEVRPVVTGDANND